jgi:transposase InsO family protein
MTEVEEGRSTTCPSSDTTLETDEATDVPTAQVFMGEAGSGDTAPPPFSITMTVQATRKHRRAMPQAQEVLFDTCSGPSLGERAYLVSIGCKIEQSNTPLFFHGFHDDSSGANTCQTNEYTTILASVTHDDGSQFQARYRLWCVKGAPVRLLIGRDQMSASDDKGVAIYPDPDCPAISFNGGPKVPGTPHRPVVPTPSRCLVVAEDVSITGGGLAHFNDMILARTSLPADTDIHVHAHKRGDVHVPDQCQTVGPQGTVQLWVVNTGPHSADWQAGTPLGQLDLLASDTPLHATTLAMLAREHRSHADRHDTTTHTTPSQSAGAHYAEQKPSTSAEARNQGGQPEGTDVDEDVQTEYTDTLPTEAELDDVLIQMVADMHVGSKGQRRRVLTMLRKHASNGLFSTQEHKTGLLKDYPISFKLTDDKPTFVAPYPTTPAKELEMIRQAELMQKEGLIHPTTSPNNHPLLLVDKKGGKAPRMCIDLRKWNAKLVSEYFELPAIRDIGNNLAASRLFSQVDCTAGYQMVPLDTTDGPVTSAHQLAFTLPRNKGRFAMSRLTFGVADAMHSFNRAMTGVLRDHFEYCAVYVDDCNIHSGTRTMSDHECVELHILHVDAVFTTLTDAGAKLGAHKTKIFQTAINALGLHIEDHTITIDPGKYKAIDEMRTPTTQKELQTAMGLLGMARRFTPGFAALAEPLYDLMAADHRSFKWSKPHAVAFAALQSRLKSTDALHAPDWDRPFEVWADASQQACGGMLLQRDEAGVAKVIEYFAHRFSTPERNYNTPEREALGLLLAAKRFRPYLLAHNKFAVALISDHKGLTYLHRNTDTNSRLYRWAQSLGEFKYDIQWIPGTEHGAADALSRLTSWITATVGTIADSIEAPTSQLVFNNNTYTIDRLVTEHRVGRAIQYRVRWQGFTATDDTMESLKSLRDQLTSQQLRTLRDTFDRRTSTAMDTALQPLPHAPPIFHTGIHSQPGGIDDSDHAVAEAATDESLGYNAESEYNTHNEEYVTRVLPDTQLLPKLTTATIMEHQRRDTRLQQRMSQSQVEDNGYFTHASGLWCRIHTPTVGPRRGHHMTVVAVPESLVALALTTVHDLAGHHGSKATMYHMQSRFSFPRLYTRTQAYIRGCVTCGRAKRDNRPVPLGQIPIYSFLTTVGIDFAGPFATSTRGYKYIAIICDHATKWVHTVPTASTSTEDAAAALLDFVHHFGLMQNVVSDRGSSFTSAAWKRLMQKLSITHKPTLSYNPQGDSHAEASVGNIKQLIKMVIQRHPRHWDEAAKWASWSYNSSYHSTLGTSPFFARHGREPTHLSDVVFRHPAVDDPITLSQLVQRVNDVHRTTQDNIRKQHERVARLNIDIHRARSFSTGDTVWLHRVYPGTTSPAANGLSRAWFWPFRPDLYTITQSLSAQHVRIQLKDPVNGDAKSQTVHVRRLKPFVPHTDAFAFGDLSLLDTAA